MELAIIEAVEAAEAADKQKETFHQLCSVDLIISDLVSE